MILAVAERLAMLVGPANCRSAISRAYYATYNVGEQLVRGMNVGRARGNRHVALQQRLLGSGDDELKQVGSMLGDFCARRNRADYEMDNESVNSKKSADAAVELANKLISMIEGCQPGSRRYASARSQILSMSPL